MRTHCKRGHPWDEANTRWIEAPGGKPYRQCRSCARLLKRRRYRHDEAWREREKARCLAYYHQTEAAH